MGVGRYLELELLGLEAGLARRGGVGAARRDRHAVVPDESTSVKISNSGKLQSQILPELEPEPMISHRCVAQKRSTGQRRP